jgi:hypothetical protein
MLWTDVVFSWLALNERSQSWLARKAGLHPMHLNRCLRGRKVAGEQTLRRLEQAMGLPPGTLDRNGKEERS